MESISRQLSNPSTDNFGKDQHLKALFPEGKAYTLEFWQDDRAKIRQLWIKMLGQPAFSDFNRFLEVVDKFEQPEFQATLYNQSTGPTTRQLVLLMEPKRLYGSPRPAVVLPFYNPDGTSGFDLKKHARLQEHPVVHFGWHLVNQGYVVVCTEAFPYNMVPEKEQKKHKGLDLWQVAAEKLLDENPCWTGMGKLVWDTRLAVDFLLSQPEIDDQRIAAMGWSLGGKMAFYAGALDERIKATVAVDFGIGWEFTNWDALWYWGRQIHDNDFPLAHHQLLALHAPRPFLLIGGEADRPESWQYILETKKVYRLYGKEDALGFLYHGAGHLPPEESVITGYRWLAEQFELSEVLVSRLDRII